VSKALDKNTEKFIEDVTQKCSNSATKPFKGDTSNGVVSFREGNAGHIFSKREGHVPDSPANRILLRETAQSEKNFLGKDQHGTSWHAQVLPDGRQAWTTSRNGIIQNGGVNQTPKTFNSKTGLSRESKHD
jgi:filamentous hemagglutinin